MTRPRFCPFVRLSGGYVHIHIAHALPRGLACCAVLRCAGSETVCVRDGDMLSDKNYFIRSMRPART